LLEFDKFEATGQSNDDVSATDCGKHFKEKKNYCIKMSSKNSDLVGSGSAKMRSGPKRLSMISSSSRVRFEMGIGADNNLQHIYRSNDSGPEHQLPPALAGFDSRWG
jgi:hypothetical protein